MDAIKFARTWQFGLDLLKRGEVERAKDQLNRCLKAHRPNSVFTIATTGENEVVLDWEDAVGELPGVICTTVRTIWVRRDGRIVSLKDINIGGSVPPTF